MGARAAGRALPANPVLHGRVELTTGPWVPGTFALISMDGVRAATAARPARMRSCSSPRLPGDVPEATA
ncbi:hypothetical protein [Streptomyces novaecaesareae]|uniref:hypothetical protein n=1 Tax=Streptomyces novaecaesareae TaxID=68244 RepID=UPI0012FEC753|nr:hypothetical protein [Streptomyces novaecaesareae]